MPCTHTAGGTPLLSLAAPGGGQAGAAGTLPAPARSWWRPACLLETGWFVLMGAADIVMTTMLLNTGWVDEVNPVARFFLFNSGLHGLVGYKCSTLVVVLVCAQLITLRRPRTAKAVLHTGIWVQLLVVAYSAVLMVLVED